MRSSNLHSIISLPFKSVTILALLITMAGKQAEAQKVWTLQQSIDHAISNNINIRQTEISSEIAEINYTQSKMALLPSLNGSSSYSYNFGRSVDFFTYQFSTTEIQSANFSVNGNLPVFSGFQLQNTLARSRYDYLAGKENVRKIKNDISLNVAAAFLQVLYGKEALKAAADRVESAVETRNRAKIMFENGMISQGNLLDAEAALAAEELAKLNADNVLVSAVINITQLLELNPSEGFEVAVPEVQIPDQSGMALAPDAIYEAAMKTLPEFKIAEFNIKSAEKGLSIARGGRYPRLNLFGSLNTGYSNARKRLSGERVSFDDQIDENYNKSLGLSLSIPIFNSWSAHSNVKRSRLGVENVKLNDQQTRNQVYKSVVQAHSDANSGLLRYNAAQKAAAAAAESYIYAEKKYNAGMLSSVEFLNIRNNKSRAETDLLQAKYDLIFRIKVIDFYLGRPLSF